MNFVKYVYNEKRKEEFLTKIVEIGFTSILAFAYLFVALIIVVISIQIGPLIFIHSGYQITYEKTIKASEAISYFLQAFLAVVIVFLTEKGIKKE